MAHQLPRFSYYSLLTVLLQHQFCAQHLPPYLQQCRSSICFQHLSTFSCVLSRLAFDHSHQPSPCHFYLQHAIRAITSCFPPALYVIILSNSLLSRQESIFFTASQAAQSITTETIRFVSFVISFSFPLSLQILNKSLFLLTITSHFYTTAMFQECMDFALGITADLE